MSTKSKILELLEQHREVTISGQELADNLQISRTAVWKAINLLREDGHRILSVSNKGYRLEQNSDMLSGEGIRLELSEKFKDAQVIVLPTVDSTNNYAKKLAVEGAENRTVVLAEEQSAGRGRMGRNFLSPVQKGIYMSAILRPEQDVELSVRITIAAAVAVCRAIEKFMGEAPQIKWVNDVFFRGKKICGILSEGVASFESGMVESVVVGIGVNVRLRTEELPEELRSIVGAVEPENASRNQIAAEILNELFTLTGQLSEKQLIQEYKQYSMVLGRNVTYQKDGKSCYGEAVDINEEGNLIIRGEDGKETVLRSGEISLGSSQFL